MPDPELANMNGSLVVVEAESAAGRARRDGERDIYWANNERRESRSSILSPLTLPTFMLLILWAVFRLLLMLAFFFSDFFFGGRSLS